MRLRAYSDPKNCPQNLVAFFLTSLLCDLAFSDPFELGSIERVSAIRFWLGSQRGLIAFSYAHLDLDNYGISRIM